MSPPRKMGEGSLLRVLFGRQPRKSPMRRQGGCVVVLLVATTPAVAAVAAATRIGELIG